MNISKRQDIDTINDQTQISTQQAWELLNVAWKDFCATQAKNIESLGELNPDAFLSEFYQLMEQRYGVRVNMLGYTIETTFVVVNKAKYSLLVLKYSGDRRLTNWLPNSTAPAVTQALTVALTR